MDAADPAEDPSAGPILAQDEGSRNVPIGPIRTPPRIEGHPTERMQPAPAIQSHAAVRIQPGLVGRRRGSAYRLGRGRRVRRADQREITNDVLRSAVGVARPVWGYSR